MPARGQRELAFASESVARERSRCFAHIGFAVVPLPQGKQLQRLPRQVLLGWRRWWAGPLSEICSAGSSSIAVSSSR